MSVLKKKTKEDYLRLLGIRWVSLSCEEVSFLLFWGSKKYSKNESTEEASLKNLQFRIQILSSSTFLAESVQVL